MTKTGVQPHTGTHANTQTFAHMAKMEMHWESSQGPGRATQGRHVSKNTQKGAKQSRA